MFGIAKHEHGHHDQSVRRSPGHWIAEKSVDPTNQVFALENVVRSLMGTRSPRAEVLRYPMWHCSLYQGHLPAYQAASAGKVRRTLIVAGATSPMICGLKVAGRKGKLITVAK